MGNLKTLYNGKGILIMHDEKRQHIYVYKDNRLLEEAEFDEDFIHDLVEYLNDTYNFELRVCSECKKIMDNGFFIEDSYEYYCSEECLYKHYTEEEYNELYEQDLAYWTEWSE